MRASFDGPTLKGCYNVKPPQPRYESINFKICKAPRKRNKNAMPARLLIPYNRPYAEYKHKAAQTLIDEAPSVLKIRSLLIIF